jgi:hypothetical protein
MIIHGTKEADAIAELLGAETLTTLRLALRQAAQHDKIGNRNTFAVLYHQLGGEAELTLETVQ